MGIYACTLQGVHLLPIFSELLLQVLFCVRMKSHLTVTKCILIKFIKLNLTVVKN